MKPRKKKRRVQEVTHGSITGQLYRTPTHGRAGFTLCFYGADGARVRKWVTDPAAAEDVLKKAWKPKTDAESRMGRMEERARLAGLTPEGCIEAEVARRLKALSGGPTRPVAEVVAEFLAGKQQSIRGRWHEALTRMLAAFAGSFQTTIEAIQDADLQRWLDGLRDADGTALGARSRHNYRDAVAALFRYARRKKYLAPDHDPLAAVELPRKPAGQIHPYSPEEMEKILQHAAAAAPRCVPYLALRAFSGVRYEEMGRVKGRAVHLPTGWIALDADITKVATRRLVKILPALRSWWKAYPCPPDEIVAPHPSSTMGPVLVKLIRAAGVVNRHNGLRDSFISYRMAELQNAAQVADEAGNSPKMVAESYREVRLPDGRVITPKLAAAYFASRAVRPTNVVRLVQKGA